MFRKDIGLSTDYEFSVIFIILIKEQLMDFFKMVSLKSTIDEILYSIRIRP